MAFKIFTPLKAFVLDTFNKDPESWMSSNMVLEAIPWPMTARTVRHFLLEFFQAGLLERLESFPAYLYRLRPGYEQHSLYVRISTIATALALPWSGRRLG